MIRKCLAISTFGLVSLLSQVGFAQDRSAAAAADVLFRQGRQLHDQKRYAEACPKFAESFRLDPATGSLLALASCHEGEGKLASAWAEYNEVIERARREKQPERLETAKQRASALEPKLAKLTVMLAPSNRTPGMQIKRGSVVIGEGAIGVALPVDRGEHVIEASAPGHQSFSTKITISDGANQVITIPKLAPLAEQAPAPAPVSMVGSGTSEPAATPPPPAERPAKGPSAFPFKPLGTVAIVGGVVALGGGTFFGIKALKKNADSNSNGHCTGDFCDPEGMKLRTDAVNAGNLSTGLIVVGGLLVGGGIALLVLGGSKDQKAAKLVPSVGQNAASLSMQGVF
jgi:hypothetical protein